MFTRGIVDTRATKSTEFASSTESVGDIEVEEEASRTSDEGWDSYERGKWWWKRGSGEGMRKVVHTNGI